MQLLAGWEGIALETLNDKVWARERKRKRGGFKVHVKEEVGLGNVLCLHVCVFLGFSRSSVVE